ncbi:uncharacterized protein F5147DRAFT_778703 [Suillus discolor]|uniref:Fungal-type protein kinase domain-containing protein n=1 Tax=Suillus discolor TaxID=1912936 RepID=A0A9P7EY58_9AGAM|nr:uncharacterized protein F5147DRAFT_778703 [Suillus discolor]KAG2095260.1 hypothetical protein F5147DRAFT_778703 [Suillus discolor]
MFRTLKEFVQALRDIVKIQQTAVEEHQILHQNCSLNNAMILNDIGGSEGFLIDWEFAVRIAADHKYPLGGTGTVAFMSRGLLNQVSVIQQEAELKSQEKKATQGHKLVEKPTTPKSSSDSKALPVSYVLQTFSDDLESLFVVFTWVCIKFCGPNGMITFFANPTDGKCLIDKFHPYFNPLIMIHPVTFDIILGVLNSYLDKELVSTVNMLRNDAVILTHRVKGKQIASESFSVAATTPKRQKSRHESPSPAFFLAVMPPRTVTSPKKKRSKRKGSEASKAGLPKKTRAADVAEVPGAVPLISLGLTAAEVGDNAPRRSGHPNAGTGDQHYNLSLEPMDVRARHLLAPTFQSILKPQNRIEVPPPYSSHDLDSHPDVPAMDIIHTGPSFTLQQPGGRFGFAAPSTTEIAHSDTTELNLQALNDPYVAIRTKVIEQRVPDAIAEQRARDTITEQRARDAITEQSVFSEQNLDPALHQEDNAVRAQYCLRLLGSEEHSDSKGSSSSDDSDDSDDEDADKDEEDNGKDAEEGNNNDTVKDSQDFGWGEVGQHQKEHPGFLEDALPSQPAVAHALTPEFEFQYSRDEDDVIAQTSLDKTSGPPDGSPGLQGQRSQHMETITSKPNNVLQCHHKKNGKPRLPEPESLKLLDQVTKSSVQPSKNKKFRSSHGGPTPNQLSWYRPHCKSFLEDAKAELCVQHALENPL